MNVLKNVAWCILGVIFFWLALGIVEMIAWVAALPIDVSLKITGLITPAILVYACYRAFKIKLSDI